MCNIGSMLSDIPVGDDVVLRGSATIAVLKQLLSAYIYALRVRCIGSSVVVVGSLYFSCREFIQDIWMGQVVQTHTHT